MNSPTSHVIVSFSREPIKRLFESGGSVKSLQSVLNTTHTGATDDLLVFNAESNPNFISFDYQVGLGGGQHKATLKFIDPDNLFEQRFIGKDFVENLAGFQKGNDSDTKENISINLTPSERDEEISKLSLDEFLDLGGFDGADAAMTSTIRSEFRDRFHRAYGTRYLYVAFGMGANTDTWAGPFKMYLQGATVAAAEGKVVTLELTPTPAGLLRGDRRTSTNEVVNMNMNGLTVRTTGYSKQVNIGLTGGDVAYKVEPYVTTTSGAEAASVAVIFEEELGINNQAVQKYYANDAFLYSVFKDINFHDMIVDCLKDYISKATGKNNVMVLLPNLNLLLVEYIEQETKRILPDPSTSGAYVGNHGAFAYSQNSTYSREDAAIKKRFQWYSTVKTIVEDLGFELQAFTRGTRNAIPNIPTSKALRIAASTPAPPLVNPTFTAGGTSVTSYIQSPHMKRMAEFLDNHYFHVALNTVSTNLIPDHEATIKRVMNKLSAAMKGRYPMQPITYVENNPKLLRLWGGRENESLAYKYHTTFGGATHKVKENEEFVIYGDTGIIQNYLYAKKELVKRHIAPSQLPQVKKAAKDYKNFDEKIKNAPSFEVSAVVAGDATATELSEQLKFNTQQRKEARWRAVGAYINYAGVNILAPMDRSILNDNYQAIINDKVFRTDLDRTDLGPLYELPDDFNVNRMKTTEALDDLKAAKDKQESLVQKLRTPIFTYNTQNGNVLELRLDFSLAYFAALTLGYSKRISRRSAGVVTGKINSSHATLPITTIDEGISYLINHQFATGSNPEQRAALIEELESNLTLEALDDFELKQTQTLLTHGSAGHPAMSLPRKKGRDYSYEEAAIALGAIVDHMASQGLTSTIMVEQELTSSPVSIFSDLLADVYRRAINVRIKTFPLFHLSDFGNCILNECLLFAQDPQIIKNTRPNGTFFNDFLTGTYQILGFRHTIDAEGTSNSEFSLVGVGLPPQEKEQV
tara:strand:+ start:3006 stop:5939 length:2934 start_codon:yes stop_codon:yes gene_type:complete